MKLPPLPKELAAFAETQARHCALNDMVQAYGQQCREQLIAERDALAADAARYRWMTEHIVSGELEALEKAFTTIEEIESITQAEFDAVIDAAIQEAGVQ